MTDGQHEAYMIPKMANAISVMAAALANNTKPVQDMDRDILA